MLKIGFDGCFSRSYVSKVTLLSLVRIYLLIRGFFSSIAASSDLERDHSSTWSIFNHSRNLNFQVLFCILDPGQKQIVGSHVKSEAGQIIGLVT